MNAQSDLKEPMPGTAAEAPESAGPPHDRWNPKVLFATGLSFAEVLFSAKNRALAGRTLTNVGKFSRQHPAVVTLLGAGGIYYWWQASHSGPRGKGRTASSFSTGSYMPAADVGHGLGTATTSGRDFRNSVHGTASLAADKAAEFGRMASATAESVRERYEEARESVHDGMDKLSEAARNLYRGAEVRGRKMRQFARNEPGLVVAGGLALALGAMLLLKKSHSSMACGCGSHDGHDG